MPKYWAVALYFGFWGGLEGKRRRLEDLVILVFREEFKCINVETGLELLKILFGIKGVRIYRACSRCCIR
jgi:hypothetical protein